MHSFVHPQLLSSQLLWFHLSASKFHNYPNLYPHVKILLPKLIIFKEITKKEEFHHLICGLNRKETTEPLNYPLETAGSSWSLLARSPFKLSLSALFSACWRGTSLDACCQGPTTRLMQSFQGCHEGSGLNLRRKRKQGSRAGRKAFRRTGFRGGFGFVWVCVKFSLVTPDQTLFPVSVLQASKEKKLSSIPSHHQLWRRHLHWKPTFKSEGLSDEKKLGRECPHSGELCYALEKDEMVSEAIRLQLNVSLTVRLVKSVK